MREILFVIGSLGIGGAERHLATVLPELVKAKWSISVYSLQGYGPLYDQLKAGGVDVILPPVRRTVRRTALTAPLRLFVAGGHLFAIMVRRRPAIVHFFLPEAYLLGGPLALLAGVPVRVMSRRSLNVYQAERMLYRGVEKILHRWMTAVLGNSRSVVRQLRDEGVPESRLGLIYNGIETADGTVRSSRARVRAALNIPDAALVIVVVGNLIRYKGHVDLLDALKRAKSRLPADWKLLLVGRDDGMGAELRSMTEQMGLADNVLFLGLRNDTPSLLEASDIGILCSHQEGFSNAVLEGMAAGLPMIVTDVGGNPEAVVDGVTGLVVPPRDPMHLAETIMRLADNSAMRRQLGEAGRERVVEHFSLKQCVQKYDQFYRELLLGRAPRDIPAVRIDAGAHGVSPAPTV